MQAGIIPHQFGNTAARRLEFDRDGNGPAVILDQEQQRERLQTRGVQRFEKFAFAGGAFSAGNVDDLVRLVAHILSVRRLLRLRQSAWELLEIERRFSHADSLRILHSCRGGPDDNVQAGIPQCEGI